MLGYDGSVRVMDFGVAKAVDASHQSQPGYFKGTIAYMSPEQIRSTPVDRRSDVFSLGVALWEATLGRRLFKASTELKTAQRVLSMPVPKPTDVDPRYPRRLERVVMRALERAPELRHPTARDLSDELADVCARSPVRPGAGELERFMERTFAARRRARKELERRAADMRIDVVEALEPSPAFDVAPAASLPPQSTGDLVPLAAAPAPSTQGNEPTQLAASAPPAVAPGPAAHEPTPGAAIGVPREAESDDDIPELDDALVRVVEGDVSPRSINREPTMVVRPRALAEVTVRTSVVPETSAPDDDAEAWRPRTGPRVAFALGVVFALGLGVWFAGRDAEVALAPVSAPRASTSPSAPEAPRASASPSEPEAPSPSASPSVSTSPPPAASSPPPSALAAPRPSASASPRPAASPAPARRSAPPMKNKPRSAPLFNGSDL
jgi:serine/threonine-protein kinase